jgi:hypothetical protein
MIDPSFLSFFLDLLSGEHLAPLEIVTHLCIDQHSYFQIRIPGEPNVGALLEDVIEFFGDTFAAGF